MIYEYEFETLKLTEDQKNTIQLGFGDVDLINGMIKEVINRRGKEGWRAMYPFSVPCLWFYKEKGRRKNV